MAKKKEVVPSVVPPETFYYGDGETVDPCLRERGFNAKRISRLERASQAAATDGLDRSFDYDDSESGDE